MFFPSPLVLYRLLSASRQNRAQSRLLYLFYDKESNNFPTHLAKFSNQTLFSKRVKVASAVYCSLIKHAKIGQSQSLLELFKLLDWLTKRQQSITNWTSAKLSVSYSSQTNFSSGFRGKNVTMPSKFAF